LPNVAASNQNGGLKGSEGNVYTTYVIIKNNVPIKMCNPWNPIVTKEIEIFTESAMINRDSLYSIN